MAVPVWMASVVVVPVGGAASVVVASVAVPVWTASVAVVPVGGAASVLVASVAVPVPMLSVARSLSEGLPQLWWQQWRTSMDGHRGRGACWRSCLGTGGVCGSTSLDGHHN